MNKKKSKLALGVSLIGLGSLVAFGFSIKQDLNAKKQQKIKQQVRQFFAPLGEIAVLYINEFESDQHITRGGVVMTDGKIYNFTYEKGQINYEEDRS